MSSALRIAAVIAAGIAIPLGILILVYALVGLAS